MKKGFRSLPSRILAAVLTAGMIVSSSNLDYVRFILPEKENVSQVEAATPITTSQVKNENLLKALEVIVNYSKVEGNKVKDLRGQDLVNGSAYKEYQNTINDDDALKYQGEIDLSGCKGIDNLEGFYMFKNITSVNLSNYAGTSIQAKAFESCSSLETVTIPNTVTNIEDFAFNECLKLKTINVVSSVDKTADSRNKDGALNLYYVKTIGESAFSSAQVFDSIVFDSENADLEIGSYAFNSCNNLESIIVPTESGGNLGPQAFANCDNLKNAILNPKLDSIPVSFFDGSNLSEMDTFPTGLKIIGENAFANTNLLIPDLSSCINLKLIGKKAFWSIIYSFDSTHSKFILPAELSGAGEEDGVSGIKEKAFANSRNLNEINIPDGITTIQDSTFEGCTRLSKINTSKSSKLKVIKPYAFRRCDSLSDTNFLKILPELAIIGEAAFAECYSIEMTYDLGGNRIPVEDEENYNIYKVATGLSDVTLPESLEKLGDFAFANNYNLENVNMLGNKISIIPRYAFAQRAETQHAAIGVADLNRVNNSQYDQEKLQYSGKKLNVNISNNITDIQKGAFRYNSYLNTLSYNGATKQESTLILPDSVTSIGDFAFADCSRYNYKNGEDGIEYILDGLGKVDIRNIKPTSLGKSIFENDFMLNSVFLPMKMEVIPERMFAECGKRVDKPDQTGVLGFHGLETVVLPSDLVTISSGAFLNCCNLRFDGQAFKSDDSGDIAVNKYMGINQLPPQLEVIDNNAFDGCQRIGALALNGSLTKIGDAAFARCGVQLPADDENNPNFISPYGLTDIIFIPAKNLQSIGREAFTRSAIKEADLSNNKLLTEIPDGVFAYCFNLTKSNLSENIAKVGASVYTRDVKIKSVMLPAIADISNTIFTNINYDTITALEITLSAREIDRLIKVPIDKEISVDFIRVVGDGAKNEIKHEQTKDGVKIEDDSLFVEYKGDKDLGTVKLKGIRETEDKCKIKIVNTMYFITRGDDKDTQTYTNPKNISKQFDLTVSDVWAEELDIVEPKEAIDVSDDGKTKILTISADKITGNDETNTLEVKASVVPSPITKAPVWGTDSTNVITIDPIDPEDDKVVDSVNVSNFSIAKLHVKGIGETKLWVADRNDSEQKVKDEIIVKVVYPINPDKTTITVGSLESFKDNFQLEEGAEDTISVIPGYYDDGAKADDDSKAKVYFESSDPTVATIDRETGKVVAKNKTDNTTITIFDDTGKSLKTITLSVVEEGKLDPQLVKITPEKRVDVYKDKSVDVTAKVFPEKVSQDVVWSLAGGDEDNYAVVKTNEDGSATLTGKALGATTLYAKAKDKQDVVAEVLVNVAVPATTLKFQKPSAQVAVYGTLGIEMTTEESEELRLLYQPAEASMDSVTWKIEDESIAQFVDTTDKVTLSNGVPVIKGLKQGVTKLIAETGTGLKATIDISVYKPLEDFSVAEKKTIHMGDTFKLDVNKTPNDSSEWFTYSSSNTDVATVDENGNVKGAAEGQATIYATRVSNGDSRTCLVTVVSKVNTISILDAPIELAVEGTYSIGRASEDQTATAGYRLSPNSTDQPTWSTSNPAVASIEQSDGNVIIKAVAPGTATITATTLSGQKATINVSVVSVNTELKFTEESKRIAIGTQAAVTVNRTPAEATESIVYSSSNEEVATVDKNGVVTAKAKGDVTIYAKGKVSNVTAGIPVTVTVPATSIKAITHYASEKKIYLVKGSTYQFRYRILPEETTDTVTFTTNKKKIATVAEDGTITAKKKGNATITAKTESGKVAKIKVYVVSKEKNAKKIKKISTSSIKVGKTVRLKYTVTAATTTNSVTYSVNKPDIAEIDEFGYITGLKKGKVKVTVTMSNGKKKTKTIKVKK